MATKKREPVVAAFGANLRVARQKMGWSQERLAKAADLDRSYLSGIEAGHHNPSIGVAARLAAAVGRKLGELVDSS